MSFNNLNSLKDTVRIVNNQYFGNYRGTIVNNNDSEFHRGRCKIFVRGIYPEEFAENDGVQLPWAEPCQPLFCGGKNTDGIFQCPDINSTVWLFFESGDITRPVFFGQTTDAKGYFDTDHCNFKWQKMEIDFNRNTQDGTSTISISADTTIKETAATKNIERIAGTDIIDDAKQTITIHAGDTINITADSAINIKAPKITINGQTITMSGDSSINISAPGGDCVLSQTSLDGHTHPYFWVHPGGNAMTSSPLP